ncbi:MAG: DUF2244 domain-containing protein [Pseudomonadota bacterium]
MVLRQQNSLSGATQIIVKGNRAMSWRANVLLAASLGAVSLLFGGGIAMFGLWLVLPFAGLEFLVVLYCLGLTYRKLGFTEVISFGESTLTVETGFDSPQTSVELSRHWTKIEFDDPQSNFEVGTLKLLCGGRSLELGRLLSKSEKRQLYDELQRCLGLKQTKLRLVS